MMDKLEIQRSKYIVLAKSFKFFLVFLLCSFSFALFTSETFAQAQQAILSLSPSDGSINRGCNFSLEVKLNTDGAQTDGTDAILIYDPSRFSATSIISGTIYPDFPGNNIDQQNGKITISGLASVTQAFTGQGTLATINFRAQDNAPTGVAQVNFDFDPINKAKTTDSNVVQRGTVADILNSVVNGNYTIGTGSCSVSGPGVTGSTGTPGTTGITGGTPGLGNQGGSGIVGTTPSGQIIYKTLPQGGTQELTATLVIIGSILTIFGILGLALL
jgi:hypothetical protein